LTGEQILEVLAEGVQDFVAKVDREDFHVRSGRIESVDVEFSVGKRSRIVPEAVVLAAGNNNQMLLDKLNPVRASGIQRDREVT
jgi:hypothetical protein